MRYLIFLAALVAVAACNKVEAPAQRSMATQSAAALVDPPKPARVSGTSDQAAATLVETYYALLEQKDFAAANRLWGDAAKEPMAFRAEFGDLESVHAEVGKPGPSEGACGSIYIDVPISVRARVVGGVTTFRTGKVTLRRVNNVDGATPAQLHWHIAAIDLKP